MIISANGNVINTKYISGISKVYQTSNNVDVWYEFEIKLFNNKPIKITQFDKEDGIASKDDLINLSNKILKLWNKDQSEIPQFNL